MKLAYKVEMSFEIPEDEKEHARTADQLLIDLLNKLNLIEDHFKLAYDAFIDAQGLDPDKLHEKRGAFSRYAQEIKENISELQNIAIKVISEFSYLGTDFKTEELKEAFKESISDINRDTDTLLEVLDDLQDPQFKDRLMAAIDNTRKDSIQLELLVKDRLQKFINTDILNKDWVSSLSEEQKITIEEKKPLLQRLQEEQNPTDKNPNLPDPAFRKQVLNPLMTQQVMIPADQRGETRLVND